MNILYLTNIPTPYRVDFFNELGKFCTLTVLYERRSAENRNTKWLNNKANNFRAHFLIGMKFGADSSLSFDVIEWIKDKSFDLVVIGGYSTPTGMLAINYLKLKQLRSCSRSLDFCRRCPNRCLLPLQNALILTDFQV